MCICPGCIGLAPGGPLWEGTLHARGFFESVAHAARTPTIPNGASVDQDCQNMAVDLVSEER